MTDYSKATKLPEGIVSFYSDDAAEVRDDIPEELRNSPLVASISTHASIYLESDLENVRAGVETAALTEFKEHARQYDDLSEDDLNSFTAEMSSVHWMTYKVNGIEVADQYIYLGAPTENEDDIVPYASDEAHDPRTLPDEPWGMRISTLLFGDPDFEDFEKIEAGIKANREREAAKAEDDDFTAAVDSLPALDSAIAQ